MNALRVLERYVGSARRSREALRCELCALTLEGEHRHIFDADHEKLVCTCIGCALTFADAKRGRYRAIPNRVRLDRRGSITEADLSALGVPVGLAFFVRSSRRGSSHAIFPSPAGPTEAELPGEAWDELRDRHALVRDIEDDVEALLVYRRRDGTHAVSLVVPIDACYELTGVLRRTWRGIDGGDEVRTEIEALLERLAARSEP